MNEMVSVIGGVEKVSNEMVLLWLSGFDGLQETPITDEMPDWMLCSEAEFRARISEENYRRQSLDGVILDGHHSAGIYPSVRR